MAHSREIISPDVELRAVKEELELSNKTRDRYALLVTKLYDELDALRNGICNTCKTKFMTGAASSSSAGRSSSSPIPTPSPILLSQPQMNPQTGVISDPQNLEPSAKQASCEPNLSSPLSTHPQNSADLDNIANSESEPDEADWSVVHNHQIRQTLDIHLAHTFKVKSKVYCVKFSRGGKHLAVGLYTGETYIYDMKTLSCRILTVVEYPPKEQPSIRTVQFSPDNKYIATGQSGGQIRIWNLADRHVLATLKGHTKAVFSVDFSPNGRFLLSGSWDSSVRIWCTRDGSSKNLLDPEMSSVTSTAISPDGRYVVAGDYNGFLRIWDFRSGQLLQRWKAGGGLRSVVFTSEGKKLLNGGRDRALRSWDISPLISQPGSRRGALVSGSIDEEQKCLLFRGHTGIINSVSTFADSRWVLSASGDSTARMWDVRTGVWQCTLRGHKEEATADASPEGHHLATGSADLSVRVWRYEQAGLADS